MLDRNYESRFANIPQANIERSRFDRSCNLLTTFNAGELVPIYCEEVLPGDSVSMDMSSVIRMSTPLYPVMDTSYVDTFFFFVPNRIIWEHWKEFMGECKDQPWVPSTTYTVPKIKMKTAGFYKNSIADYLGLPVGKYNSDESLWCNALPIRAYVAIWNEWFRDQNLMNPAVLPVNDATAYTVPQSSTYPDTLSNRLLYAYRGWRCLPVSKYHDRFTSCLPSPQRGDPARLPMQGDAPVYAGSSPHALYDSNPIMFWGGTDQISKTYPMIAHFDEYGEYENPMGESHIGESVFSGTLGGTISPNNLYADLSGVTAATINELRMAFATQKWLEAKARGGSRYREILKSVFGVVSPDARQQVPEYLGGTHQPLCIDQVVQTSGSTDSSYKGSTGAMSYTQSVDYSVFNKSFTEHGWLIGVACMRTNNTYQDFIRPEFHRENVLDYYTPQFSNVGEMPVYKRELFCSGIELEDNSVFGYQEAWSEYRYGLSRVAGEFRSSASSGLDSWHYAQNYASSPSLSAEWIVQSTDVVDRTLTVSSSVGPQILSNFYFKPIWTRPMPVYSVPGLIDHF